VTRRAIARRDDVRPGEMIGLVVGRVPVLLANVDGAVHAWVDSCPHRGVPLSRGRLAGRALVCGAHQWTYNVCTGRGLDPNDVELCPLTASVEGDQIWVELPDEDARAAIVPRVGPVLRAEPAGRAVAAAIRDLNPDAQVLDRGAELRVLVPGACLVTRAAIEQKLGAPFRLPEDLEALLVGGEGELRVTHLEARWAPGQKPEYPEYT
jgi:toluene monooxygenase system ferredoxin subunit